MSLRGAVSIARRLQDPLAELVKIDPKSIGVGQYQHDVTGTKLERSLDAVVEDAVNAVGVDVNTASRPLLARVSGITDSLAGAIVAHRDAQRRVRHPRAAQGRARGSARRRSSSARASCGSAAATTRSTPPACTPRRTRWSAASWRRRSADVATLIGNTKTLRGLNPPEFTDEAFGLPTVNDILRELEKPGRDPRPEFQTATFAEGVHTLGDLEPGMVLEGVVTNVAAFGAFVDIGVHQDGLVHVSAMSSNFVADPRDVAKSGDVVKVKVLSVDIPRNRISLTMRLREDGRGQCWPGRRRGQARRPLRRDARSAGPAGTSRGDAGRTAARPARPGRRTGQPQARSGDGARRRRALADRQGGDARRPRRPRPRRRQRPAGGQASGRRPRRLGQRRRRRLASDQ